MADTRKVYAAEFKLAAVTMITEQKLSVAEVARRLGVAENLLHSWKKAVLADGAAAFPGAGHSAVARRPAMPIPDFPDVEQRDKVTIS